MASPMPDHTTTTTNPSQHHRPSTIPLASTTKSPRARPPCLCNSPKDCQSAGAISKSSSPLPSLHTRSRAPSDHQQRPFLASLPARHALAQPAYVAPAPDWKDTKEHLSTLSATFPPIGNPSVTSLSPVSVPHVTAGENRSLPIPIAAPRKQSKHSGRTPLSGRPPSTYISDRSLATRCARSRTPSPSSSFHTHYSTPINLLPLERHPYNMSSRPSQSSPLSPTAPAQPINIPRPHDHQFGGLQPDNRPKHRARPAAQNLNLNLAGLPKYHPANFPTSGDNTPLSPRSIQALSNPTSKRNTRTGSDAQHALHKYQREIVTRASGFSSELAKPTSPRLIPEGSPAGSMTPLALEAQSDYLLSASNLPANAADARKIVDHILQKENEERHHPEARRDRSRSPAVTPPV